MADKDPAGTPKRHGTFDYNHRPILEGVTTWCSTDEYILGRPGATFDERLMLKGCPEAPELVTI
jgi:hypothetical protein